MLVEGSVVHFHTEDVDSYIASVTADFVRRELLSAGVSFTFETVMSYRDKVDFLEKAQARGYRTYLYFVATEDPQINVDRVHLRMSEGGHPVDDAVVIHRYARSIALLADACDVADRAFVFDNSGDAHRLTRK